MPLRAILPLLRDFSLLKIVPSDFGLFEPSCHITYMRGFSENSSDKDETKSPLVSYQYYEEKNILKKLKQNRGTVSLQHNERVPKNSFPEFWTFSDSVS